MKTMKNSGRVSFSLKHAVWVVLTGGLVFLLVLAWPGGQREAVVDEDSYTAQRHRMVARGIEALGVSDEAVLEAMRMVPRHLFVPAAQQSRAYENYPLPIGHGQTISQPYIVGLMTQLAAVGPDDRVLEIGTGSGYQAAVLSEIVRTVYTIEYIEPLGLEAAQRLKELGYENIHVRIGDGYKGWPAHQPFDAIVVTAAIDHVPQPLKDQLRAGGRIVIPVGSGLWGQDLQVMEKDEDGVFHTENIIPVRFVPFLGPRR